jgi:hypothetical protein
LAAVCDILVFPHDTTSMNEFFEAQSSTNNEVDKITACLLRAPETIINGPWDEKVDI